MKKFLTFMLTAVFLIFLLAGCTSDSEKEVPAIKDTKSDKLQVVATLFPQYDFARQIAGDRAEVILLLPPGVESHSFEPRPSDIIKINESELFIYTGEYMEPWSQKIINSMKDSGSRSMILDMSHGIELVKNEEIEAAHHQEGDAEEAAEHEHLYDPHIWTDPINAKVMAANISDALCSIDPANADYYKENAAKYYAELDALDAEFKNIVSSGNRDEIIFGSRFALYYFTKRYGLSYQSAFDSCSSETEPSARTVAGLIEEINKKQIPAIYFAEMEEPKVAESIGAETGAKLLLFHSCHNVTKEEWKAGATYLSLMKQNAENLKEGLK